MSRDNSNHIPKDIKASKEGFDETKVLEKKRAPFIMFWKNHPTFWKYLFAHLMYAGTTGIVVSWLTGTASLFTVEDDANKFYKASMDCDTDELCHSGCMTMFNSASDKLNALTTNYPFIALPLSATVHGSVLLFVIGSRIAAEKWRAFRNKDAPARPNLPFKLQGLSLGQRLLLFRHNHPIKTAGAYAIYMIGTNVLTAIGAAMWYSNTSSSKLAAVGSTAEKACFYDETSDCQTVCNSVYDGTNSIAYAGGSTLMGVYMLSLLFVIIAELLIIGGVFIPCNKRPKETPAAAGLRSSAGTDPDETKESLLGNLKSKLGL